MFGFFKKKYLNAQIDKREKAHQILDNMINEPDSCVAFDMRYNLDEYIKGLKAIYEFKEV